MVSFDTQFFDILRILRVPQTSCWREFSSKVPSSAIRVWIAGLTKENGWWFQLIWNICSSHWIISPRIEVKIEKHFSYHHLVVEWLGWFYSFSHVAKSRNPTTQLFLLKKSLTWWAYIKENPNGFHKSCFLGISPTPRRSFVTFEFSFLPFGPSPPSQEGNVTRPLAPWHPGRVPRMTTSPETQWGGRIFTYIGVSFR